MKAIADENLIGEKNNRGFWEFEIDNVIRWRGDPKSAQPEPEDPYTLYSGRPTKASMDAVVAAKRIAPYWKKQMEVQAEALAKAQDALQTKLLEDQTRARGFWGKLFS